MGRQFLTDTNGPDAWRIPERTFEESGKPQTSNMHGSSNEFLESQTGVFAGKKDEPPAQVPDHAPPARYICYRCGKKGHWSQVCLTNDGQNYVNKPRLADPRGKATLHFDNLDDVRNYYQSKSGPYGANLTLELQSLRKARAAWFGFGVGVSGGAQLLGLRAEMEKEKVLQKGTGNTISDVKVYRSSNLNLAPESIRSGLSEPNTDASDGDGLINNEQLTLAGSTKSPHDCSPLILKESILARQSASLPNGCQSPPISRLISKHSYIDHNTDGWPTVPPIPSEPSKWRISSNATPKLEISDLPSPHLAKKETRPPECNKNPQTAESILKTPVGPEEDHHEGDNIRRWRNEVNNIRRWMDEVDTSSLSNSESSRYATSRRHSYSLSRSPSPSRDCQSLHYKASPKLESTACCDRSFGFETDSTSFEDDAEWEDNPGPVFGSLDISSILDDIVHSWSDGATQKEALLRPILTPMKQSLVDRIMTEFWIIFNQEWTTNIRRCASTSPTRSSASAPDSGTPSQKMPEKNERKCSRDEEDDISDGNDGRGPKRPRGTPFMPEHSDENTKFACPYRKHDPRKYCVRSWRSCALTPLETIARVKGHLYRCHRVFQCPRCKELFKNQTELDTHFTAVTSCELSMSEEAEGINNKLEQRLKSRKKTHRDQTEEERWKEIYQILFPMEAVPTAYFEPLQEDIMRSPDSEELANYEEFSRRELPRVFRSALEAVVNDEAQPMEERLRSQLVGLIKDCQERVFSVYRSLGGSSAGIASPPSELAIATSKVGPASLRSGDNSTASNHESQIATTADECSSGLLGAFYEGPPAQSHHSTPYMLGVDLNSKEKTRSSDSGYVSDLSKANGSQSSTLESLILDNPVPLDNSRTAEWSDTETTGLPQFQPSREAQANGFDTEFQAQDWNNMFDVLPGDESYLDCPNDNYPEIFDWGAFSR